MDNSKIVFCIKDYSGQEIVFTREKLEQKKVDHPELSKKTFMKCVKNAIINPDEVWEDYSNKTKKRCYYKKYSAYSHAKVVIWVARKLCQVVTAYEIDYIKEKNYPGLKRFV